MPANPPAKTPGNGAPKPKGKPGGIPLWGWIAAGVLGLVIAYVIAKKSGIGSSASDTGTAGTSDSSPLGRSDTGNSAGGVVAPPPADLNQQIIDELRALGVIGGGSSGSGSSSGASSGTGDSGPSSDSTISPTPISADSSFINAGFQTSSYISSSGNPVIGPGGPVIDVTAPVSTPTPTSSPPSETTTETMGHGAVIT